MRGVYFLVIFLSLGIGRKNPTDLITFQDCNPDSYCISDLEGYITTHDGLVEIDVYGPKDGKISLQEAIDPYFFLENPLGSLCLDFDSTVYITPECIYLRKKRAKMVEKQFKPFDIDQDGYISTLDDLFPTFGDNMITREDFNIRNTL